jgi:hypothetical protein
MKANRTTFGKGHIPHNNKPLLFISIRLDKNGTQRKYIKIKEPNVWITYAKYIWLKNGGKIKAGYGISHRDKNTLNDDFDNLICVPQNELKSLHNKWNTKNIILNETKQKSYRYKRRLKLNAINFIKRKPGKRAKFKRFSKCVKVNCEHCKKEIETNVMPNPLSTIRQRMDIFINVHNKLIHNTAGKDNLKYETF